MKHSETVKRQLKKAGNTVYIRDGEWSSMPFKASISRLWRKKTSDFEMSVTEIGETVSYYYLFIGPYDHDITVLSDNALLVYNGEKYEFKCKDPVMFNDEVVYYSGILRKLREGGYDET